MSFNTHNVLANLGNSSIRPIPVCAIVCSRVVSDTVACPIGNRTCVCDNDSPSLTAIGACIRTQCTLDEALATQAFQADYCGHPNNDLQLRMKLIFWMFFGFAAAFTLARPFSRCRRLRGAGFWYDDLAVFVCAGFAVAIVPITMFGFRYGMGKDQWEGNGDELSKFLLWTWIQQILHIPIVFGTKLSLVFLYLRIWPAEDENVTRSPFRVCCYILATLEFIYGLVSLLVSLFQCWPVSYNWNQAYANAPGSCIQRLDFYYLGGAMVIVFDILTVLLPLPKLVKLGLPLYSRVGIFITFIVGFGVTAASLFRIQYLDTVMHSKNITWDISRFQIWTFIEMYLSLICCSMPPMAGVLRRSWTYVRYRGGYMPSCISLHDVTKSAISKPYRRADIDQESTMALTEPRTAPIIRVTGGSRDGVFQPTAPLPPEVLESGSRVG